MVVAKCEPVQAETVKLIELYQCIGKNNDHANKHRQIGREGL